MTEKETAHMTGSNGSGRFVWRDLMTPDPEKSEAFYTSLFDWKVNPVDMGPGGVYRMLRNGETDFGGIGPLDDAGVPPYWVSHITTPNVDETTSKAAGLGATVLSPPMDIPNVGRFSVMHDPEGAVFSSFSDSTGQYAPEGSTYSDGRNPGGVTWNELTAADAPAEANFYSQLFGYTVESQDMGTGPYTILSRGPSMEDYEAGIFPKPPQAPASAWTIYFNVPDLDKAIVDVSKLDGQTISPIIQVPGIGRVAMVTDSLGAVFGVHEPASM
jgi:predicted enzyme related to lactoylglutathione lyase